MGVVPSPATAMEQEPVMRESRQAPWMAGEWRASQQPAEQHPSLFRRSERQAASLLRAAERQEGLIPLLDPLDWRAP